jgi:membrane-bound serine protease (ClpP class)
VHGERWHVACATPLAAGSRVRVSARSGLTLTVTPLHGAAHDKANEKGEHS